MFKFLLCNYFPHHCELQLQALSNMAGKSKRKSQGLFYLYIDAVSIKNSKSQYISEDSQNSNADTRVTELLGLFSFSPRDLEFIVKFSEEHGSDIFRQILQSICPSIYGHELVKGGFDYNLFLVKLSSRVVLLTISMYILFVLIMVSLVTSDMPCGVALTLFPCIVDLLTSHTLG